MATGVDLDEVTFNTIDGLLVFYYDKTGIRHKKEDFYTYDWRKVFGTTTEETVRLYYEFYHSPFFDEITPVKDAIPSIKTLAERGETYIVTARPMDQKEKTDRSLVKHGIDHIPVVYSSDMYNKGESKTKVQICQELGIDRLVEDQEGYSMSCAKAGIKVILKDKPWNQEAEHNNIIRVPGWKEGMRHL